MKIVCGKDTFDISEIAGAYVHSSVEEVMHRIQLSDIEERLNGYKPHDVSSLLWDEFVYSASNPALIARLKTSCSEKSLARLTKRNSFINKYKEHSFLEVELRGHKNQVYFQNDCGFDIYAKEREIDDALKQYKCHQEKVRNSNDPGEKAVEYALKWILAEHTGLFVSIVGDCESKHRYNCILLSKPDFIDETQEYDHILVSTAGIVLIETKHWGGHIEIRPDGKWLRKTSADSPQQGSYSPKLQMKRHEILMRNILPNVPVYSLLCFTSPSVVIDGRENFKDYPIVMLDQLGEALLSLCSSPKYSSEEIHAMIAQIESYKVNH